MVEISWGKRATGEWCGSVYSNQCRLLAVVDWEQRMDYKCGIRVPDLAPLRILPGKPRNHTRGPGGCQDEVSCPPPAEPLRDTGFRPARSRPVNESADFLGTVLTAPRSISLRATQ